jgi:hypothetical protein
MESPENDPQHTLERMPQEYFMGAGKLLIIGVGQAVSPNTT